MLNRNFSIICGFAFAGVMLWHFVLFGYFDDPWYSTWWRLISLPASIMGLFIMYLYMSAAMIFQFLADLLPMRNSLQIPDFSEAGATVTFLALPLFLQGFVMALCGRLVFNWMRGKFCLPKSADF